MFFLKDHWVWDFWMADDGQTFHLFYLHAPKSLGDQHLRHRNARIGHATSSNLIDWTDHGQAFPAGEPGTFDTTATWTGSVVRGHDGLWRLYYTGSRFLSERSNANVETISMAVSEDLYTWEKKPGPIVTADPRWYETLGTSSWPEEAWRDPWVFADPHGNGWHMLVTARANFGDDTRRGVVGHAVSDDMEHWEARPPLSEPGVDFAHLEVLQMVSIEGREFLIFSCDTPRLAGGLAGQTGGIWWVGIDPTRPPFPIDAAKLLAPQTHYAGRLVETRNSGWALMAFDNRSPDGVFQGGVSDPIPVILHADGSLSIASEKKR